MGKTGKTDSVGEPAEAAGQIARRLDNRATLERETAYFKGAASRVAAEEAGLESALSAASQGLDFDQP